MNLCIDCRYHKTKPEPVSGTIHFFNHHCTHEKAQDIVTGDFDLSCYDARLGECKWFDCGLYGEYWEKNDS